MKQLSRLGIQRMIDTSGSAGSGGSGGSGDIIAGLATQGWVEENYLSIEFFSKLFKAYGPAETSGDPDVEVVPNDVESTISNIKAMFGLWTDEYLSALGLGPSGGGGLSLNEPLASINTAGLANHPSSAGQTIVWNGSAWAYGTAGAGSVTSVGMTVPTGFVINGSPITSYGTLALSFATGYGLPLTADVEKGVTAYGWGNHANAGYALASNVYSKADADGRFLTISFFRSLFKAYQSNDTTEVVPNNGDTSLISSIKAMFGFWTEQYISALGLGPSGGGGVTLNEPLSSINSAGLSAPSVTGSVLMWNGSSWTYNTQSGTDTKNTAGATNNTAISLYLVGAPSQTANPETYTRTGCYIDANGYLFSGGVKVLTDAVQSIVIGASGTPISPVNGVLTLPEYPTVTDTKNTAGATDLPNVKLYLIGANGQTANPQTYTNSGCYIDANGYLFSGGVKVLTDAVQSVVIGASGTPISPVNGVVTLPAYPSKTSDLTNDSGFITGYTDTKNTAGATDNVNTKLFLIGSTAQGANPQTYSNQSCYIGSDNCLYSGGSKVMTAASGYLPLSGGALNSNSHIVIGDTNSAGVWANSYISCGAGYGKNAGIYGVRILVCHQSDAQSGLGQDLNPNIANGYDMSVVASISASNYGHLSFVAHKVNSSTYYELGRFDYNSDGTISFEVNGAIKKKGGTSNGFLKADGSVDTSSYGSGTVTGVVLSSESTPHSPVNGIVTLPALSTSGGTLSGANNILSLSSTSVDTWIYFKTTKSGTLANRASVGYYSNLAFVANDTTYARIGVADDGTPQYWPNATGTTKYTLLHTGNLATAGYLPLTGGTLNGNLQIFSQTNTGGWGEGVRMHVASNGWCGVVMCGSNNTGDSGTSSKTWGIHNKDGVFWINRNGADAHTGCEVTCNASGYWGVGTTSPSYLLDVAGTVHSDLVRSGGLIITTGSGLTGGAVIPQVTIGQSSLNTSYTLLVDGTCRINNLSVGSETTVQNTSCATLSTHSSHGIYIKTGTAPNYVDGSWSNASDMRLKDVVSYIGGSIGDIANAPIFNFRWRAGGNQVMVGTSAQYWQKILPNTVTEAIEGYLYMDYAAAAIAAVVITARKVQEHDARIKILERENEALRKEIQRLKAA